MTAKANDYSWLTYEAMDRLFSYDSATGELTWKPRERGTFNGPRAAGIWATRYAGKRAGTRHTAGYTIIRMGKCTLYAHRVAWALHHKMNYEDIPGEIDHRDLNKQNNAISNLRPASRPENSRNEGLRSTNTSGVKGVWWNKAANAWQAQITVNRYTHYLGIYKTIEEATEARRAAQHLHGEFARMSANDNLTQQAAA